MCAMRVILFLVILLILYGLLEYRRHLVAVRSIPIRVHVNGTRGKSSVTRLIAAGLRGGGVRTVAKTTGTRPRFIFEDGREEPVVRHGKPNIIEQVKIVRRARRHRARALVIECMAVRPELQLVSERRMVRATVSVITNARGDHLDEMGPTLNDVALALCLTIPKQGIVFTAEKDLLPVIEEQAKRLRAEVRPVADSGVNEGTLNRFGYVEHPENVALALAVCGYLGVNRDRALEGMVTARPDPGALRSSRIIRANKEIEFVNAFAANDAESVILIWKRLNISRRVDRPLITILFNRGDRPDRAKEFGRLIAHELCADHCILVGQSTTLVEHVAVGEGLLPRKLINMAGAAPEAILKKVLELTPQRSLVVGIGNIVGIGEEIAAHFENRREAV